MLNDEISAKRTWKYEKKMLFLFCEKFFMVFLLLTYKTLQL